MHMKRISLPHNLNAFDRQLGLRSLGVPWYKSYSGSVIQLFSESICYEDFIPPPYQGWIIVLFTQPHKLKLIIGLVDVIWLGLTMTWDAWWMWLAGAYHDLGRLVDVIGWGIPWPGTPGGCDWLRLTMIWDLQMQFSPKYLYCFLNVLWGFYFTLTSKGHNFLFSLPQNFKFVSRWLM